MYSAHEDELAVWRAVGRGDWSEAGQLVVVLEQRALDWPELSRAPERMRARTRERLRRATDEALRHLARLRRDAEALDPTTARLLLVAAAGAGLEGPSVRGRRWGLTTWVESAVMRAAATGRIVAPRRRRR